MAARTKAVEPQEDKGLRLSITIDPSLRKNMRIAAAINDSTVGEWAAEILEKAASKSLQDQLAEDAS